ncbi:GntR family transcriptional regulator [Thermomonospora echinospora]|uniref:GntR family transcriptional regulator n=1 Tax=Thermomonospora echinospora TaxID=1992 RepID=A0A1H6D4E6_9ACTN|nr:GntR family transcriptional regulator [Thermomonospora echinospora]SEG80180.1 GntR family transcriptional regulator [Thermomonospora echinospora]
MPRPPARAQAITNALAARIVEGELAPGSWLPSERELAGQFAADRSTVRRAVRMLADQGLVVVHPGTGTQVRATGPVRRAAADITRQVGGWRGFHVSARQDGREPFTRTTVSEVAADAALARWLAVPVGTTVLRRARVQGVVGEPPVQTAITWVIMDVVAQLPVLRQVDTGPGGIYSRLEELGYRMLFEESVTCRPPRPDECDILQITADQPVLTLWRRGYDHNDRIVEVTHRVVVGDRHELIYRYGSGV